MIARQCGWTHQFNVVDHGTACAGDPGALQGRANILGLARQGGHLCQAQRRVRGVAQKKPGPAPSHVAMHGAKAGYLDRQILVQAKGRHVFYGDVAARLQLHLYRAHRGVNGVLPRRRPPEMRQRRHQAYRAVATHAQVTDVVEKYD